MAKHKQRFNKKEAVRFTLVPGFDENGKPITHFRPVETRQSKVSTKQRQKLIQQISDEVYDEIQINGKIVGEGQIPAFVLEQIRGRKDLIFNQKQNSGHSIKQQEGDLYEIADADDFDNQFIKQQKQWIDEEEIIDEQDYQQEELGDDQGSWQDEGQMQQQQISDEQQTSKANTQSFKLNQEDFPVLNKVNLQGKQYELTEEQIKLLDVLLPENYENYKIKGLTFQKYDQNGLPLSQKSQYEQFLSTGKQGIVDSFSYVPDKPTSIYDNDIKPSQLTGDLREIEDALNFEGDQEVYQQLEDDFFSKLIQSQIQLNKKQKKQKKQKRKTVSKSVKPQPTQISKAKLPQVLLEQPKQQNKQNIFAKYDQLDEEQLEQQITDQMVQKALDDFQKNLEPENKGLPKRNQHNANDQQDQMEDDKCSKNNYSLNFSQIQKNQELFGKDGQLDWRRLTKKQKKQFMRTKIIREFYDQVRQRQIQEKIKGKKNVTAEQLHLKTMIKHISYQDDHVMRRTLEEDAKIIVDFDQHLSYTSESEEEDIVEYHQRTSVISAGLNQIREPSKRKPKKFEDGEQQEKSSELDQLSATLSKIKSSAEKRNRNQTKQERKQRKQKQKELKKQKREVKKQFIQKFNQERRKHMKMTKPTDPLHKISYVKII